MAFNKLSRNFKRFFEAKYIFSALIADKIFFFIYFLFLARLFEKSIYGQVITIFTFCNIIIVMLNLGLPMYIQRVVAIERKNSISTINIAFFIYTILLFFYLPIILITTIFLYPTIDILIIFLIAITVYFFNFISLINGIYNGLEEYKRFFLILISVKLFMTVLIIFLFILNIHNVRLFVIVLLITALFQFFIQFLIIKFKFFNFSFKGIEYKEVRKLLIIIFPLYLASIFNFLYDKMDVILISKIIDFNEVANYSIAYGIYKSTFLFFMPLLISGYTKISYLSRRISATKIFIKKYSLLILFLSLFLIVLTFILSKPIVVLLYGQRFENSHIILKILSFAILFIGLNGLLGNILNGLGKFKENRNVTFFSLFVNIILNIIFIPTYGIIAAAVVTILTELLVLLGDAMYLKIALKFKS